MAADTANRIAQEAKANRNATYAKIRRTKPEVITADLLAPGQFELGRLSVAENYIARLSEGHSPAEALRFAKACHHDIRADGYLCPDFNAGAHTAIGELDT